VSSQQVSDFKIITGRIVDRLLDIYNSHLVEKISFSDGLRYRLRIFSPDNRSLDIHIVNKFDKLFIELWLPNYASPLIVLERSATQDVESIVREIVDLVSILWRASKRRRRKVAAR